MKKCPICDGEMSIFDEAMILKKYKVNYWQCRECGFIQTDNPYWLNEAYSSAIVDADIGLASRNYVMSELTAGILDVCLSDSKTHLDFGGGYGLFTRLMRDKGFDFQWYDKYCDNLFAKHFEKNKDYYDVVTAYEVFEHLPNPVQDVGEMLSYGDNLIFCTSIVPEDVKDISSWWYFMPYHGQHISFYTKKSLSILAAKFGRKYVGYGDMHMFTKKKCSTFKFALSCRLKKIIQITWKRKSLLMDDYNSIIE